MSKSYSLYILFSRRIDKYYIGISSNPYKRLKYHNLGKGGKDSFTRRASDWEIVYTKEFIDKEGASEFERLLKSYKSRAKIKQLVESSE